jgi:2,4-dienoyl-CoA reductase-like NADH-dependent reductase (Old Yellow Enzyme family)
MTEERILEVFDGSKVWLAAKKHGFGMVKLHGAHGGVSAFIPRQ